MSASESLANACEKVNHFFGLTQDRKFNFLVAEGPQDDTEFNDEDDEINEMPSNIYAKDLVKFFQWIFENMYIIKTHVEGCNRVHHLLDLLNLNRMTPIADTDEEIEGLKWFRRITKLISDFLFRFMYEHDKEDMIYEYYHIRACLFEILRHLLYPEQMIIGRLSDKMKDYVRNLRLGCFLYLQNAITYLPAPIWLDMSLEIKEEHEKWIEVVASFYFLENQMLLGQFPNFSQKDKERMNTHSLMRHQGIHRELAYALGFIVDCINAAYGIPTQNIIKRPIILHENECIIDLCTYLIKNIRTNSMIKSEDYGFSDSADHIMVTCASTINGVLKRTDDNYQWGMKTNQLLCFLQQLISMQKLMNDTFLRRNHEMDLRICFNGGDHTIFFGVVIRILEILLITEENHANHGNAHVLITPILSKIRKTSFQSFSFFFVDFRNIFTLKSDEEAYHVHWAQTSLLNLLKRAQPIIKTDIAKDVSRLSRIFATKKPTFPDENMEG